MNIILNDIPQGHLIKNIKFEISFENGEVIAPKVHVSQNVETANTVNPSNVPEIENRASKDVPEEMLNSEF